MERVSIWWEKKPRVTNISLKEIHLFYAWHSYLLETYILRLLRKGNIIRFKYWICYFFHIRSFSLSDKLDSLQVVSVLSDSSSTMNYNKIFRYILNFIVIITVKFIVYILLSTFSHIVKYKLNFDYIIEIFWKYQRLFCKNNWKEQKQIYILYTNFISHSTFWRKLFNLFYFFLTKFYITLSVTILLNNKLKW